MKTKFFMSFCLCFFLLASTSIAGDSTSIVPPDINMKSDVRTHGGDIRTNGGRVDTQGGRIYTRGNHIYTSGGNFYAGGGDLRQVRLIKTNRIYAQGSGSWINVYDHFDMNNRVIYDVRRLRVNELTPSHSHDVASKWYVDKKAGAPQGTMCGMWSNNPYIRDRCKGHNPKYSCPPGYAKRFDGSDFGTCVKQ